MKTPIEAIIDMLEINPNQVITKENMLHALRDMLPTEQEHLEAMADTYNEALKSFGMKGMSGKELFERRYRGKVQYNPLM